MSSITIPSFVVGAGADRCIYLGVSQWKNPDVVPTAVFNGSENFVFHDEITIVQGSGVRRVTILKLVNPTVTTANIVVSWSGAVDEAVCGATSWFGVDQTTPFGTAVKNSGPGPATTSSVIVPNTAGDAVHDTTSWDGPASAAVGTANQTLRWKNVANTSNTTEGDGQSAVGAGSNITCTWSTETGGTFAHIGVAIRQSSSGPVIGPRGTRRSGPKAAGRGPYDQRGFVRRFAWETAVPVVAGSAVTVTPDVGSLVLDGFAPTIGLPQTVTPGLGQLTLTGFAPSIGLPVTVTPALGQLTLTGFAPTIGLPMTVTPALGQLTLVGFAPTISTPVTVTPGLGQLVLDGFAPTITVTASGVTIQPALGQLSLTGFAPSIGLPVTVAPGLGQLTMVGYEPTIVTEAAAAALPVGAGSGRGRGGLELYASMRAAEARRTGKAKPVRVLVADSAPLVSVPSLVRRVEPVEPVELEPAGKQERISALQSAMPAEPIDLGPSLLPAFEPAVPELFADAALDGIRARRDAAYDRETRVEAARSELFARPQIHLVREQSPVAHAALLAQAQRQILADEEELAWVLLLAA